MYLVAVETTIQVGLVLFIGTQLLYPMWKGTALFPAFRRRQLVDEIIEAKEEEEVEQVKETLETIRKRRKKDEKHE